jgi:hypothetical protein
MSNRIGCGNPTRGGASSEYHNRPSPSRTPEPTAQRTRTGFNRKSKCVNA